MMPEGLEAAACSMIRAMSARSPVDGLRYSTVTPRSCSAFFSAFLMVFHQESESGPWLTNTNRSPAACARPASPRSGKDNAAAMSALRRRLGVMGRTSRCCGQRRRGPGCGSISCRTCGLWNEWTAARVVEMLISGRRPVKREAGRASRGDLEQPGRAHAAADAHGDDAELCLALAPLDQEMAGEPGAGHAVGMAHGDRPAVDVETVRGDPELVAAIEDLHGKSLVQLPQVDILDLQAVVLQELRHGEDRADPHLVGLAARDREA